MLPLLFSPIPPRLRELHLVVASLLPVLLVAVVHIDLIVLWLALPMQRLHAIITL